MLVTGIGEDDEERQSCSYRRAGAVLSQAFHSSLFILTKRLRSSPLAALLSKIISLLQLLSFLFAKVGQA